MWKSILTLDKSFSAKKFLLWKFSAFLVYGRVSIGTPDSLK